MKKTPAPPPTRGRADLNPDDPAAGQIRGPAAPDGYERAHPELPDLRPGTRFTMEF